MAKKKSKVQAAGDLLARMIPGLLHPLDDPARPLGSMPFRMEGAEWLPAGLEKTAVLHRDPSCPRCVLGKQRRTVCMDSPGPVGAPLLVLTTPTERDDAAGQAVETGLLAEVLQETRKLGVEVRVTWAVRCAAGEPEPREVDACRPYLAEEVDASAGPIVALGPEAALALTGVALDARRTRRGWAVVRGKPARFVLHPSLGQRNRFFRQQFRVDLQWALATPFEPAPDGGVEVLLSPARAVEWLRAATRAPMVFDSEHWPKSPWARVPEKEGGRFRLLCLGLCQDPARPVVLPEEVLHDPDVRAELARVMEDPSYPKLNQDAKHDVHVLWRALGISVQGIEWDTLIASRLLDSDAPSYLKHTQWKVGFGGAKDAGQVGADDDDDG